jgi:hypothetical protein
MYDMQNMHKIFDYLATNYKSSNYQRVLIKNSNIEFEKYFQLKAEYDEKTKNVSLLSIARDMISDNVQNNKQSYEQNSNGCFQELKDEEKSICGKTMKVKSLRCPNGVYTRLFWAVKNESYLSCLKYKFRDDTETGWFKFQDNIIHANDGIFLTEDRSFEKAARLACSCDK